MIPWFSPSIIIKLVHQTGSTYYPGKSDKFQWVLNNIMCNLVSNWKYVKIHLCHFTDCQVLGPKWCLIQFKKSGPVVSTCNTQWFPPVSFMPFSLSYPSPHGRTYVSMHPVMLGLRGLISLPTQPLWQSDSLCIFSEWLFLESHSQNCFLSLLSYHRHEF